MGYVCEACGLYFVFPKKKPAGPGEEETPVCPRCGDKRIRKVD